MTAALPLLGALVSTAKAVRNSEVMMERSALRAEAAYLCSLISEHVFQLLEGRLVQNETNPPQQQLQHVNKEELEPQMQGLQGCEQVQEQQQEEERKKYQELELEVCQALLGAGLQLFVSTITPVYAFAALAAEVSLQCIKDQQLAEVLVEAAPPFLSSSLQQMLQQARSMCSAGMAVAGEMEGAVGPDGVEGARHGSGVAAAPTVPAAAEKAESLAASRLYSRFRSCFQGHDLPTLIFSSSATPYLKANQELLHPALLFPEHQAELWQQVMADTEEGSDQPGKLIGCLFRAAASLQAACKHLPEQLLAEKSQSLRQLVDVLDTGMNEDQLTIPPVSKTSGPQQPDWTPDCASSAAAALYVLQEFVSYGAVRYVMCSKLSFCCGDPACPNLRGRSELELVLGVASGKRGGGYCSGCKRVWYCSEACQRECWEEHSKVCKEVGRGARKAASSKGKGRAGSTSGSRQ
jgi:hypothetical protein